MKKIVKKSAKKPKKEVAWKLPWLANGANPNKAYQEIEKIEKEKGEITKESVLKAAENPKSELHNAIEWHWGDDKKAAHKFRLAQAMKLINNFEVTVISNGEEKHISNFELVSRPDETKVYKSISSMTYDEKLEVKENTKRELKYLQGKLQFYSDKNFLAASVKIAEAVEILG